MQSQKSAEWFLDKISMICLLILDKNKRVNAIFSIGFVTLTISLLVWTR